ncbi:MAG: menaquinone biosynthesis protein [Planctomycetota bacterium]
MSEDEVTAPLRVAAVSYLNARPLVWDLERDPRLRVEGCPPAEAARRLLADEADLALVPVAALLRDPELTWLPGLAIAADGPVDSVFLYLDETRAGGTEPAEVALDPKSRTSQLLAGIVLERFLGRNPAALRYRERDPDEAFAHEPRPAAILVIGDAALGRAAPEGWRRIDLAEVWREHTGLPFVFAVWGLKRGVRERNSWLEGRFRTALEAAEERLEEVVDAFAEPLRVGRDEALRYLRRRIVYRLGPREREGLELFLELARPRLDDRGNPCST